MDSNAHNARMILQEVKDARHTAARGYLRLVSDVTGKKPSKLATECGFAPSTLNKHFSDNPPKSPPEIETLLRVKQKFGVPFTPELTSAYGLEPQPAVEPEPQIRYETTPSTVEYPDRQSMLKDIPVLGVSLCDPGTGDFSMNHAGGPIDWVRRPPGIAKARGIFAVNLQGDSMLPWFKPNQLIFLSEHMQPQVGGLVVVELLPETDGDTPPSYFKLLVRRTADHVELQQSNPPQVMKIKQSRIKKIYRVLTTNELLGV